MHVLLSCKRGACSVLTFAGGSKVQLVSLAARGLSCADHCNQQHTQLKTAHNAMLLHPNAAIAHTAGAQRAIRLRNSLILPPVKLPRSTSSGEPGFKRILLFTAPWIKMQLENLLVDACRAAMESFCGRCANQLPAAYLTQWQQKDFYFGEAVAICST